MHETSSSGGYGALNELEKLAIDFISSTKALVYSIQLKRTTIRATV